MKQYVYQLKFKDVSEEEHKFIIKTLEFINATIRFNQVELSTEIIEKVHFEAAEFVLNKIKASINEKGD